MSKVACREGFVS